MGAWLRLDQLEPGGDAGHESVAGFALSDAIACRGHVLVAGRLYDRHLDREANRWRIGNLGAGHPDASKSPRLALKLAIAEQELRLAAIQDGRERFIAFDVNGRVKCFASGGEDSVSLPLDRTGREMKTYDRPLNGAVTTHSHPAVDSVNDAPSGDDLLSIAAYKMAEMRAVAPRKTHIVRTRRVPAPAKLPPIPGNLSPFEQLFWCGLQPNGMRGAWDKWAPKWGFVYRRIRPVALIGRDQALA